MKLAVVGATGVVGEMILRVLDERAVSVQELGAFASRDRVEPLRFRGREVPVRKATPQSLAAGRYDASAELAQSCVASGAVVIDNSATYRMAPGVPLVVPEVNSDAVQPEDRIFPVANCTAIVLVVGLAPIERVAGLRSVRVATYQSVSGAGRGDEGEKQGEKQKNGTHDGAPC